MKLTVVKIRKYRERKGQCLKQGISDIKPEFDFSETQHFISWTKKMFFYSQNFATKNKIANIREIHQHPDRCKKIGMQLFCIFTASLKNSAREKPEMVWEEALILSSCCLPTNCSVLLLERQETRDDETSLGKKEKQCWVFPLMVA